MLYQTIGLVWPCVVEDVVLADAYARAYNRWIADFCRGSGGRLIPIAATDHRRSRNGGARARAGSG